VIAVPRVKVKLPKKPRKDYPWMNEEMKKLFTAALCPQDFREQVEFFRDLLTDDELRMIAQRWNIAEELWKTRDSYEKIAKRVETSTTTVGRIAQRLWHGEGGLLRVLETLFPKVPSEDELEGQEVEEEYHKKKRRGHLSALRPLF